METFGGGNKKEEVRENGPNSENKICWSLFEIIFALLNL
jgi:hypothetical protein